MKLSTVMLLVACLLACAALLVAPVLAEARLDPASHETGSGSSEPVTAGASRAAPSHRSLAALAGWLAAEFGLAVDPLPRIGFLPAKHMSRMRVRAVASGHMTDGRDVVAIYDDDARTIYLPEGWTGGTSADTSILVHEMVHHAQNLAGARFECPQAREMLAYEAQSRWLATRGSDLARAFGVDAFTRLVLTSCGL